MYNNLARIISVFLLFLYWNLSYGELRDPTKPSDYEMEASQIKAMETATLVLAATVISEDSKFAIINNDIVKIGDVIGGQKIKSIDPYSVTLVGEEGEVILHLFGSPIKEPIK